MATVMAGWLAILQLLAIVSIVAVALGLMIGAVRPGDALKHIGAILGIVILLSLLPGIVVSAWSRLLLWQKLGITAVVAAFWFLRQSRRRPPAKHSD